MGTLPAITADSLGNRTAVALGLPPLTRDPGDPSTRQQLLRWVAIQDRDPPGQWTDDAWQQANSFNNAVYIAVNTIMVAMGGATVVVSRRAGSGFRSNKAINRLLSSRLVNPVWRKALAKAHAEGDSLPFQVFADRLEENGHDDRANEVRQAFYKSTSASATGAGESDWEPVEAEHEIARLFASPNAKDTTADFLSEYVLCRSLFGQATVMWNPGRDGKPADLWNLRKNYLTALPGLSGTYPSGAYRYTMPQPMLWTSTAGAITIPRERIVLHRRPHPRFPWDGYSPLTAGNKYVDHLNAVVDSRQMAMDRGLSLDAIVSMAGATADQLDQADARIRERYTGSNRGQRFMTIDGERVSVNMLGTTPDKMSYTEGYNQGTHAVLALFGVPAVCAFLADADYSGFFAAARAWREGGLNAEARSIGDRLTKDLIHPHWGDEYRVEIKLPPIMDPDQRERQASTMMSGNALTINELRAMYDMPPMQGGDVTPKQFEAEIQKKAQPDTPEESPEDPIAALLGGQDPTAEPAAPGDIDNPDVGAASDGSLPGAVAKSVNLESLTRAALKFAKAMGKRGPNPCWPGYEMVGTKLKNGRRVPNCVPIKRKKSLTGCGDCSGDCDDCQPPRFVKAEYQGREVTLNKPFRTKGGAKKFAVYVKNDAGNVVIVRFGDPNMEIKRDDPEARKNFRARHNCADAKDRTKAAYWSCRMWSSTPVSEAAN